MYWQQHDLTQQYIHVDGYQNSLFMILIFLNRPGKQNQDTDAFFPEDLPLIMIFNLFVEIQSKQYVEQYMQVLLLHFYFFRCYSARRQHASTKVIDQEIDRQHELSSLCQTRRKTYIGFKSQTFVRNFNKLHLVDNILFRETTFAEKLNQQLVLP